MTAERWILLVLVLVVAYCGNRLAEIAAAVDDIQYRLKHVYPISRRERERLAEEAEIRDG